MTRKGLCITCMYDKNCVLPSKFPVWQCEEFFNFKNVPQGPRIVRNNSKKHEEETQAE